MFHSSTELNRSVFLPIHRHKTMFAFEIFGNLSNIKRNILVVKKKCARALEFEAGVAYEA